MPNYYKLGKLPLNIISEFKEEILKRKISDVPYQWIKFDRFLNNKFQEIFENKILKIQRRRNDTELVQKAFYSDPGHGFRIHKDGTQCKSALNIAISCNEDDWVRWYDEDYINQLSNIDLMVNNYGTSRNTNIIEYESIPYIDELRNEIGDVYVLNVDKFHSFKCNGVNPRIVIQTKFEGFPDLENIYTSLKEKNFKYLQK